MARRTKRRRSQAEQTHRRARADRQAQGSSPSPASNDRAVPSSQETSATGAGAWILRRIVSAQICLRGVILRGVRALFRALASVDWRAVGLALLCATTWSARGAWSLLCASGRLVLHLARGLIAYLRSVDWRRHISAIGHGAAWTTKALLRALAMVPSLLLATGRGLFFLARTVAIVALTLLFSALFVGAVLLGAGHVTAQPDERDSHLANAPAPPPADPHAAIPTLPAKSNQPLAAQSETPAAPRTLPPPTATLTNQTPRPASCSSNTRTQGPLLNPARLPDQGPGFARIFPHRDLSWGTDELVGAIERAAAAIHDPALPPLMVGNLSGPTGDQAGADPFHPSRYSRGQGAGRAGDILFFLTDALGRPVPAAETNIEFDAGGQSVAGVRRIYLDEGDPIPEGCHLSRRRQQLTEAACPIPSGTWRVDFERTWRLVRALLTDPEIGAVDDVAGLSRRDGEGIRFIFVDGAIKRGILSAAREAGEPEALVEIAGILLHDPSNASTFDRFMRVDLWCTEDDKESCDCRDGSGPWNRWRAEAPIGSPGPRPTPRIASAGAQ